MAKAHGVPGRFAVVGAAIISTLLILAPSMSHAGRNIAPTVTLTLPAAGASYLAPATVQLSAQASDSDGAVVKVEFFAGTALIGTSTTPPYEGTWSNVAAGTYSITAKATDDAGSSATSAAVSITVNPATSLVITTPPDGAFVHIDSTFNVSGTYEGLTSEATILVDDPGHSTLATVAGNSFSANLAGGLTIGANTITARLERADRTNVSRSITVNGYSTPVLAFITPPTSVFTAPATVTLAVNAIAPGGSVTQVEFLNNSVPVGTVTAPPYQVTLSNLAEGTYTIQANGTSNRGPVGTTSTTIQVLGPNTLPSISITAPTSGSNFNAPATIPISVNASDPDGSVTQVEYFANGGPIFTANTPPFSVTWSNVAEGSYALTARATDNRGGQTTSSPVNVTVGPSNNPPTASLISPTAGASFTVPGVVTLTSTASDPDGTIARVDYYAGTTLIGGSTTPPYEVNWTVVQPGTYSVIARAVDNGGRTGDSPPIAITISGTITYLHSDFTGSPIAATDTNGAIIWKENYRPYGDRLNNQLPASGNRQWFHGKPVDLDAGLSYFGARYYDPSIGRFMGVDPKTFSESSTHSFNRYLYGNNNTYRYVDPDGRWSLTALAFGAIALGSAAIIVHSDPKLERRIAKQLSNILHNENQNSSDEGNTESGGASPPLPDTLVGTPDDKSGVQGGRVNNGPLDPKHGGTGDSRKDFDKLSGGKYRPAPEGSNYPSGTLVGDNGVALRPAKDGKGPRIEVPANGPKPHETLHY